MADHRASALLLNTSMQMRRRSCCCLACSGCQAPLHGVQVAAPALLRQTFAGTYYVLEANRLGNQHTAFAHLGT